eukprot:3425313-Pyramimonas_sp.AAC.1
MLFGPRTTVDPNNPVETACVHHLIYADNVYVVGSGSDPEGFQSQVSDLTCYLRSWAFGWKLESLELAAIGVQPPPMHVAIGAQVVPLKPVQ